MRGRFFSYLRVSTDKQGANGYGIEAQRKAISDYLNGGDWHLLGEYVEVESGRRNDRPELAKALAACKKAKARLLIARLDRLSRNVAFLANLMEAKVKFTAVDMPTATDFTVHIYAALGQEERRMISDRTKKGLAAAKARGVKLGNPDLARVNKEAAAARARALAPVFAGLADLSACAAARALNERGITTPSGSEWRDVMVTRVRKRLAG